MSIANVVLLHDRAFVATDTVSVDFAGRPTTRILGGLVHCPKLLPIPHARLVIAFRGCAPFTEDLRECSQYLSGVDTALRELPESLNAIMGRHVRHPEVADPWAMKQEVYCVGWSESQACMAMARYWFDGSVKLQRHVVFASSPSEVTTVLTSHSAFAGERPTTAARHAELTRQSVLMTWQTDPHHPVGGQLIVAEVTRDTITLTNHGDLGLPAPRHQLEEETA